MLDLNAAGDVKRTLARKLQSSGTPDECCTVSLLPSPMLRPYSSPMVAPSITPALSISSLPTRISFTTVHPPITHVLRRTHDCTRPIAPLPTSNLSRLSQCMPSLTLTSPAPAKTSATLIPRTPPSICAVCFIAHHSSPIARSPTSLQSFADSRAAHPLSLYIYLCP